MIREIVRGILLVFLSILFTDLIFALIQFFSKGEFSGEELIYSVVMSELGFFLPFLIYFYILKRTQKFLEERTGENLKIQYKYLIGLAIMLIAIVFIATIVIIARGLSLREIPQYLFDYLFFVVFAPVLISLESFYEMRFVHR
ncbi:MAG TPA: hypothetical protein VHE59_07545 [Mucilaginibacter sp.]|nr:hypothetical protein [Mucilaginibacter sp.]